jgi:hypothetical protein
METSGSKDIKYMVAALKEFYQIDLDIDGVNINIK